jgi:hypothetical protein
MPADLPLKLPPGIVRAASDAEVVGRWYDGHLVRWVNGVLRPIGGWDRIASTVAVASKIRKIHTWTDNGGVDFIGVLCDNNAYVYKDGDFYDITPVGGMAGPSSNPLEGGFGTHEYNLNNYGDPRPDVSDINIAGPAWSMSNWGEDLVFMSSFDGRLLRWKPSTPATKAEVVPGAPVANRCFVITPQRHCVIFGLGGVFNKWGWCSQEDIEDWDFLDPLNTAGSYEMFPAQRILCAIALKSGVLWFTTEKAYFSTYLGVPYVYGYEEVGDNMSPIAPSTLVGYSNQAAWVALNGFWTFDGGSATPVASDLLDYFVEHRDPVYTKFRASAVNIGTKTELWFCFPSKGKTENDQYVSWDYVSQVWSKGKVGRTCGVGPGSAASPIMSDGNFLFYHERGQYYGGADLPYIESAAINMKSGTKMSTVLQATADHNSSYNNVFYSLIGRIPRLEGAQPAVETQRRQARPDGYIDWRMTARDFRLRIEAANDGGPSWSFGQMLIKISQRGGR